MAIISSGIWDIDPTVTDGTQLAGYLNELVKAINTNQSSATRPPMIKKGGLWTKTLSGSDIAVMVYDGTKDYEIGKIVGGDIQLDSIWTEEDGKAVYDGDVEVSTTDTKNPTISLKNTNGYAGVIDAQHDAIIKSGGFEALRVLSANRNIKTASDIEVNGNVVINDDTSPNVLFNSGGDEKGYIRTMMPFESLQLNGKGGMILSTNGNEAMKIDSNRNVAMGGLTSTTYNGGTPYLVAKHGVFTSSSGAGVLRVIGQGSTYGGGELLTVGNEGNNSFNAIRFRVGMLTVNKLVGSITCSPTETSYNTTSDHRIKENVAPMSGSIDKLKQLKPCIWKWKINGSNGQGFVAHEVQSVVPEAITGTKDAMRTEEYEVKPAVTDKKGNVITKAVMGTREVPDYQGIDQSKLVPLLTSALQEAVIKIENLETKLEARLKKIEDQLKKKKN